MSNAEKIGLAVILFVVAIVVFSSQVSNNAVIPTPKGVYVYPSSEMAPTFQKGDRIPINPEAYKQAGPRRWDLVVYVLPENFKKHQLKRVVGLPGETVEIRSGRILINGEEIELPASLLGLEWFNDSPYGEEGGSYEIPEEHFYILGDNSLESRDSRHAGAINRSYIIGKAIR